VRRPGDSLDGGLVLVEARKGLGTTPGAPEQQFVVVAARRKLLVVE